MSAPEHPANGHEPDGRPTRYAPTDSLSRHEGAEGHGDQREGNVRGISPELNRRSEFIQELQHHAEEHRSRVPAPDGRGGAGSTPP